MTSTWTGKAPRQLDEALIEEVRRRIGIPVHYSPRNHNEVSSTDSFRHFALAYGDDNPLYSDPRYAAASSWGSSIAPRCTRSSQASIGPSSFPTKNVRS